MVSERYLMNLHEECVVADLAYAWCHNVTPFEFREILTSFWFFRYPAYLNWLVFA